MSGGEDGGIARTRSQGSLELILFQRENFT